MMPDDYNANTEMHPEDREVVKEGKAYAKDKGAAFCSKYRAEIDSLITEYGDSAAEAVLGNLRERFWLREWEDTTQSQRTR